MAAAPISPTDYDRIFGPAEGFTKSLISTCQERRTRCVESNSAKGRTLVKEVRCCDNAIVWLKDHAEVLDAARARMHAEFKQLMLEFVRVLNPETPAWAYPVGTLVYAILIFLVLPYFIHSAYPTLSMANIAYRAFRITYFFLRIYFTFRSRILHHFGTSRSHSQALINIATEGLTTVFAVGAAPFRAAPLAEAWAGLTGRERVQSNGERTLIMVLVIIAVTILEIGVPSAIFRSGRALVELARGDSVLRYIAVAVLSTITGLAQFAYIRLTQIGLRKCQLLADYIGYRWDRKHPILRGFTDQLLATYYLPNPTRDREMQADAALVVLATNT